MKRININEENKADVIDLTNKTRINERIMDYLIAKTNWRTTTSLNY